MSEPNRGKRKWKGKQAERRRLMANRRRIKGVRGKRLMRRRGELVERPFAHGLETGGMRRVHLKGRENILKRLLVHMGGVNFGLVLRALCGVGTPRTLQDGPGAKGMGWDVAKSAADVARTLSGWCWALLKLAERRFPPMKTIIPRVCPSAGYAGARIWGAWKRLLPRAANCPDAQIWRYMDLPKLLSFLSQQCLYLTRLDQLADPFEGRYTPAIAAGSASTCSSKGLIS